MREQTSIINVCLFLYLFPVFTGCDQTFQPLQENDKYYFSIYGTLDAAADTQWVRLGPTRQDINQPPDTTGIQVILEDLQEDTSIVMKDSLFQSKNFLNYWTTFDIKHEQSYRIKAVRRDGKSSQVVVTTPKELPPVLVVEIEGESSGFYIYIDDSVGKLADIQAKWYVILNPKTERLKSEYTFPLRHLVEHTEVFDGAYVAFADTDEELEHIRKSNGNAAMTVLHRQFFVAGGGPDWDENISQIEDVEYFLNGTASNVENGLGYVIGISSKWVPFEMCLTPDKSNFAPCPEEQPYW